MQLNVDPGFDADMELAQGALERGWLTRETIESAILAHERTPGSRLLNHLPLTPDQLQRLLAPEGPMPPEIEKVAQEAARRLDHYILGDFLHSGGMGRVYKAWDLKLSRWVALKCLKAVGDERSEAYFDREARLAAGLSHPNIAAIYASGRAAGESFIAMQLIPGKTLDQWGRRDVPRLVTWIRDAARAVAHANSRGIVHRDLKPTNVMVTPEGQVYVLDFGLARPVALDASHSATGKAMGTPAYMSPEQARGEPVDARADVYSLGATLFECLTGRAPFSGTTIYDVLRKVEEAAPARPRRLNPRIAPDLETIILKCLEKDAARRYRSADELADDLDRYLHHDPIQARPAGMVYRLRRNVAKRKALALASLASVVLAGVLGWWFLVGRPHSEELGVSSEHLRRRESAMKLWAEARGLAMAGVDPEGIRRRAKDAREGFERALEVREDAPSLVMKARCLELEGRDDDALKSLERAHELDPNHAEARLELAKALLVRFQASRDTPSVRWSRSDVTGAARLHLGWLPKETVEQTRWRQRGESLLSGGKTAPAQESLLAGLLAMGKGEHAQAADALAAYAKAERWDSQVLRLEGICRYFSQNLPGAVAAFNQALSRTPHALGYRWRGIARYAQGDSASAIEDFTKAIELDGKDAVAYTNRGLAMNSIGRFEEAILDFSKAIGLYPKHEVAYNDRGVANRNMGKLDEAIADFTKAVELDSGYAAAYSNRGLAKQRKGLYDEAIVDYSKGIELDPTLAIAFNNRGVAKWEMGLDDEAVIDANRAIELDPGNSEFYYNRANPKKRKGLHDEAIADYSKAIELNPKFAAAYTNRGDARKARGRTDEAIADYTKAIEFDSRDEKAYANRGVARAERGELDGAIADFTKVIELNPGSARAYRNRGLAKRSKGRVDDAIADYTKAIELDPRDATALYNRGNAARSKGRLDDAVMDWTRAIEADPNFHLAYMNRGSARAEKGLFEEAIADFTMTLQLKPDYAMAYLNRGIAWERQRSLEKAKADYEKALEVAPPEWPQRSEVAERLKKLHARVEGD